MRLTKSRNVAPLAGQAPPRVRHAPSVRANAWEDVSDLIATLGVVLDDWQENVLQAAMGERADGRWAASQVGVSTPRQNGKSQLIVARALAGALLLDEKMIIISAHQQDTAREVFGRMLDIIDGKPSLAKRIRSVMKALNREYIAFDNGAQIRFKARSAGGGRGFSADCLLLDEAQILSEAAWAAILPTLSARPNPQVWLLGTPPTPLDDGAVFGRFRAAGLEGKDSRLAYLEWAADPGDDLDDPEVWAKANPAYGTRIGYEAISDERSTLSDDQFAMERLGMWSGSSRQSVIDLDSWALVADESSFAADRLALAIDIAPDRSTASVAVAGMREDGRWHVELDENRRGTAWLAGWIESRCERADVRAVVVDAMSPAASLIDELAQRKIKVTTTSARDMSAACGNFFDGVMDARLAHIDQPQLTFALSQARKRPIGDGGWGWNRKHGDSDITPIVAATLALWGAQNSNVKRPARKRSSSGRRAVVL